MKFDLNHKDLTKEDIDLIVNNKEVADASASLFYLVVRRTMASAISLFSWVVNIIMLVIVSLVNFSGIEDERIRAIQVICCLGAVIFAMAGISNNRLSRRINKELNNLGVEIER